MKIYSYEKCSTCRKALKFLKDRDVEAEVVDITAHAPSVGELKNMLKHQDGELKKLFNTSGIQYRELGIAEKLKTMNEEQALKLLAGNGRLVKRPFVLTPKEGLVGFDEARWKKVFGR